MTTSCINDYLISVKIITITFKRKRMKKQSILIALVFLGNSLIAMQKPASIPFFSYKNHITFDNPKNKKNNERTEKFVGQGQGLCIQTTNFSPTSLYYYLNPAHSNTVSIYEEIDTKILDFTVPESYYVYSMCYSPNNNFLALVAEIETEITNKTIISIIDTKTQQEVKKIPNSYDGVKALCLAYSNDGNFLVATPGLSEFTPITIFDVSTAKEYIKISPPGETSWMSSSFTNDFSLFAAGTENGRIHLFDLTLKKQIGTLPGITPVFSLSFSPDNLYLAASNMGGQVNIWNILTRKCITLTLNQTFAYSVAWNPQGTCLACGNYNGTIDLWNPQTGELIQTLSNKATENTPAFYLQFNKKGNTLMSGHFFNIVCFWGEESK